MKTDALIKLQVIMTETGVIDLAKRKIILDCDEGHDDAGAMLMAYAHPAIDLIGITIVSGTQTLDNTVINGLQFAQLLDMELKTIGIQKKYLLEKFMRDAIAIKKRSALFCALRSCV